MKKFLVVGSLLTVIATPAFAQSLTGRDAWPFENVPQSSHNGHSAFARDLPVAEHTSRVTHKAQDEVGIFENLPAGVTDPYAYHNQLMRQD
jgi:hypothetical protein